MTQQGSTKLIQKINRTIRPEIMQTDHSVNGLNMGINAGESAGQTIFHCHIHLIPRRTGDVEQPRGG